MTRAQYERARQILGQMRRRAREAHEAQNYAKRDECCRRHDEVAPELMRHGMQLGPR